MCRWGEGGEGRGAEEMHGILHLVCSHEPTKSVPGTRGQSDPIPTPPSLRQDEHVTCLRITQRKKTLVPATPRGSEIRPFDTPYG